MIKKMMFVFTMLIGTSASGADSQVTKDFHLKATPDIVSRWIRTNPDTILKSTHLDVLSRKADDVKVRRVTRKGVYEFKLRESIEENRGKTIFSTKLIETYQGGLQDQVSRIYLEPSEVGTKVTVYMSAVVSERRVGKLEIKLNLNRASEGLERCLKGKFNPVD